jgi:hypothetical protein
MKRLLLRLLPALAVPALAFGRSLPPAPRDVAPAQDAVAPQAAPPAEAPSPWYLERGVAARAARPADEIPEVALELARTLRDGSVPGFYDGQFASTKDRFDELAAVAGDRSLHHVLRMMAVMALQEADRGERLAAVLEPLILPADYEWQIEYEAFRDQRPTIEPGRVHEQLGAVLSRHARFALAKAGRPDAVLAKVRVLENYVHRRLPLLLDPTLDANDLDDIRFGRAVIFDIGYHFQQFDDFENAAIWFRKLTDHLPGKSETRMAHYNLACISALSGKPDEALAHLRAAYAVGFLDVAWMLEDGDLRSLRERPEFRVLADQMRNLPVPPPVRAAEPAPARPGIPETPPGDR